MAKAETMATQWVPGVNALGSYGRWAFAELRSAHEMEADFAAAIAALPAIPCRAPQTRPALQSHEAL